CACDFDSRTMTREGLLSLAIPCARRFDSSQSATSRGCLTSTLRSDALSNNEVCLRVVRYRAQANALSLRALSLRRGETRFLMLKTALRCERLADALEFQPTV